MTKNKEMGCPILQAHEQVELLQYLTKLIRWTPLYSHLMEKQDVLIGPI